MGVAVSIDSAFARLVVEQDGVLTRQQLATAGVDRHTVRRHLLAQRWQTAVNGLIVVHNGPLTERQRRWVAVLAQSGVRALAGLTAAMEYGLPWRGEEPLHVVVGLRAHVTRLDGVRIHVSRRFGVEDVHPARVLPTVRAERALVDAAAWAPTPRIACGLVARGVQQRLTTASRLRAELEIAGAIRHAAILRNVLGDIEGGAQSFAEIDVCRLARKAGLPAPRRQSMRTDRQGRKRYIDVDFDAFLLEVDGGVHLLPQSYWDDMQRQNDLIIVTGKPVLRIPTVAIRLDENAVIRQLADARRRFWP